MKASSEHPGQFQEAFLSFGWYLIPKHLKHDNSSPFISQHPSNIEDNFKVFYSLQTRNIRHIYSWSSSNAIQKAFYKGSTFFLIGNLHSNDHQQHLVMIPHTECLHLRHDGVSQQHAIPAPGPFLFAPPANPLTNNQQDPFAITGSSLNIYGPANPLPINQQDPFAIAGSSHNMVLPYQSAESIFYCWIIT
ncbi:hypothetical protein BU17DRAFT_72467 [Hysterangium stoloniferum]|nr:hypothetical protein BU17DRAFT_72467 [Hysterangium stoloniferum]